MQTYKIKNYPNFSYVEDEKIGKYLTKNILDMDSKEFKPLKKTPYKDFIIQIRVSKMLDGKQKSKKKLFKFTKANDKTIIKALQGLKDIPEEMLSQMKTDDEKKISIALQVQQLKTDKAAQAKNRTLNEVWGEFSAYKKNGTDAELSQWRSSTYSSYKSFYNVWIEGTSLGDTPIKEVTKDQCNALIGHIKQTRSLRTASTVIEVLRPLFDWYFEKHNINLSNPVPKKKKKAFNLKNERVIDISIPQIKKLYKAMDNYEDPLFRKVFMWLRTGRRRGEILSLEIEHIDLESNSFLIEAKNNKANVDMEYVLRPELKEEIIPGEKYIFESPRVKGQQVHPDTITKHWNTVKENIGGTFKLNGKRISITLLHLHDIRHIINGVLKSAEVPEEVRNKVLGHKNTSINNRYGKAYYNDADRAYQLFIDIVYGVVPEHMKWYKYE